MGQGAWTATVLFLLGGLLCENGGGDDEWEHGPGKAPVAIPFRKTAMEGHVQFLNSPEALPDPWLQHPFGASSAFLQAVSKAEWHQAEDPKPPQP